MPQKLDTYMILTHAADHCHWGSNIDNTIREPEPADLEAAQILRSLRAQVAREKEWGEPPKNTAQAFRDATSAFVRLQQAAEAQARCSGSVECTWSESQNGAKHGVQKYGVRWSRTRGRVIVTAWLDGKRVSKIRLINAMAAEDVGTQICR